jgi:Tol biopolymer transport system component
MVVRDGREPRFAADGRSFTFSRSISEIHIGTLDSNETRRVQGLPEKSGFASPMPAMNAAGDIAFVLADEGPVGNLWVYRAATGETRQLTTANEGFPGVLAATPVWMPDGESILYAAADGEFTNTHLWKANAKTGAVVRLSSGVGGYAHPALSRDGSRLLYEHARPRSRLVRTNPATGESSTIHENRDAIALPVISKDGTTVVYFYDSIYTQSIDGGEPVQQTFGPTGEATLPTWSRSDDLIYYYKERALHRLDPATGESELVLDSFHWTSKNWLAVHGDKLAYRWRRPLSAARTVVLDLASGEESLLEDNVLPSDWSRDGSTLLGRRREDYALMTCKAPDFSCSPILDGDAPVDGAIPRWSSDESRVFFRRARSDKPGYADIWVVDVEGGEAVSVAEIGPYEPRNVFFAIAHDDSIVWNEYDSRGRSEIWLAEPPGDTDP